MYKEVNDSFDKSLKKLIEDNSIFDTNATNEENFNKILIDLNINNLDEYLNQYSSDDRKNIEDNIESIKKLIKLCKIYNYVLNNALTKIDFYVDKYVNSFEKEKFIDILSLNEKEMENLLGTDNLDKYAEEIFDKHLKYLEDNRYLYNLVGELGNKLQDKLFIIFNNDAKFKDILSKNDDCSIFSYNIINLFSRNNYRLFDNISYDTALLAYDKGLYKLFGWFNDECLEQLDNDKLTKIGHELINNYLYREEYFNSKFEYIYSKVNLKDLFFDEKLESAFFNSNIRDIYEKYKYIDEESLDFLLSLKSIDLHKNDYVMHNKEYVKKIINNNHEEVVFYIPDEIFDDDMFEFLLKRFDGDMGNLSRTNFFHNWEQGPLLRNEKALKKIALNIYSNEKYFLDSIPDELLKKEYVTCCLLNGMEEKDDDRLKKYYDKSIESISAAIDFGYKCNYHTNIINNDEIKLFIDKGQSEILEYYACTYEDIIYALEKGYVINKKTILNNLFDDEIDKLYDYCLENNHKEFIIRYYNSDCNKFFDTLSSRVGNLTYEEYFKKYNLLDEILDITIFTYFKVDFNGEDWKRLIEEKYDNYKTILNLTNFVSDSKDNITKENYEEYFDENGPTKKFCELYLYDDSLNFNKIVIDNAYKNIYKDEPWIVSYIDFKRDNLHLDYQFMKDKIQDYFNEKGPTKKFFEYALFNDIWFRLIYSEAYFGKNEFLHKTFNDDLSVINYIKFRKENMYVDYSKILNIEDIRKYFDELGPTRALLDNELLSSIGFESVFEDDVYKKRYSDSPSIISYIDFKMNHSYLNFGFIKNNSEISEYFDSFGPSKKLYDYALFNKTWFEALSKPDYLSSFINQYNNQLEVASYINFRLNSPSLNYDFINDDFDVFKVYFNDDGVTENLYNLAFDEGNITLFNVLKSNYKMEEYYKDNKAISTYIRYINKYDVMLNDFFDIVDVDKYFDSFGYTEKLQILFNRMVHKTRPFLGFLEHNDKTMENLDFEFVNMFKYYILDNYFNKCINKEEKYKYLLENIGPKFVLNIDSGNIYNLISYDISDLNKFFSLFYKDANVIPYQETYNNFIVSIVNSKFKKEKAYVREIFTNMNSEINRLSIDEINEFLNNNYVNGKYTKINDYCQEIIYSLNFDDSKKELLKQAIIECKNLNELPLRKICRQYLELCQRKFLEENKDTILKEFNIYPKYSKEDAVTKINEYLQKNNNSFIDFKRYKDTLKQSVKDYDNRFGFIEELKMTKEEFEKVLSINEEQYELIMYSIYHRTKPDDCIKKEFGLYKRFMNQFVKYGIENGLFKSNIYSDLNVKQVPVIPLKDIDMIGILSELDFEIYLKTVDKDSKLYEQLKKVCTNYALGKLPDSMTQSFENLYNIKLPGGINNIGLFITKFDQIIKNKQRILSLQGDNRQLQNSVLSFMETVGLISSVNSETYEIKRLLGSSEYFDFISNKEPNSSVFDRIKREEILSIITDYLYSLTTITIPPHDMIIKSDTTGKSINFIVGNRTNASNICHGERTGACMRVGGIGEGLFLKCITDKNWFHIRIENPDTHEYISRVSGFRNGNTVYLNQLRYPPSNSTYTNDDLQDFIKIYADKLIEETKNTEYPVENVFINTGYAMTGYESEDKTTYSLGYDIQKEYNLEDVSNLVLRGSSDIWTDVRNSAYLLSTTSKTSSYVPLKNGPEDTIIYSAQRDKIYGLEYVDSDIEKHRFIEVNNDLMIEKINRVHAMKEKLLGSDYKYDIYDEIDDYDKLYDGYASSDWYVYIDKNNNIHSDYISHINDRPYTQLEQAYNEMNMYKEILINKYNLNNEVGYAK